MDPWHDILNGTGEVEEAEQPLLTIARFFQQMGVLDTFDSSKLSPPAAKEAVNALKKVTIKTDTDYNCPICLRELQEGDTQVFMPCDHSFHDECIMAWLGKTNSCPVCRHELRTDDPAYEEFRENKRREKTREQNVQTLHNSMYS